MVPEIVYHYTNAAGLHGIISSGQFWATDIWFLNDAEELNYARMSVLDELQRRADIIAPPDVDGYTDAEGSRALVLRNIHKELDASPATSPECTYHVYVACFCDSGDLLSQWRAYGGDLGYAVGFRSDALLDVATSRSGGNFMGVTYGIDTARPRLDQVLENLAPAPTGRPGSKANVKLMQEVLPIVATIKHPTFSEEREWRLFCAQWGLGDGLNFRSGAVGLIPYINLPFPKEAISSLIVGPGRYSDVRKRGALKLLEAFGLGHVPITGSESPIRL